MIDTHCHLDHCKDTEAAHDPTLTAMITIGTTLDRCKQAIALAEKYDNVYAAVGIHPNDAEEALNENVRADIAEMAKHPKVVGIGESGFDYYWDKVDGDVQHASFLWQAELAASLDKALILHVRDKQGQERASLESIKLMQEVGWSKGILHCCNGHEQLVDAGLELGWHVSFAGNLTYKKAVEIHAIAERAPQDRILVETDSPFLSPEPRRGRPNVPANVRYTAAFLAKLRNETIEVVEEYTDANAKEVYGLPI